MPPDVLHTSHDPTLVVASFLVSVCGAYAALWVATLLRPSDHGRLNLFNVAMAGLSLGGISIWSMHFLGMLALKVPVPVAYEPWLTGLSLAAAVGVSSVALGYMAARRFAWRRLFVAGPLTGAAIAVMHYMGMYGMAFGGVFEWAPGTVALSLAIAVVAATVALWLAFHTRGIARRAAASLVMGAAVCSMHYTGMSAATLVCTTPGASLSGLLHPDDLGVFVALIAISLVTMISTDTLLQRLQARSGTA